MENFLCKKEWILCSLHAFYVIEMTLIHNDDHTFFYKNFINAHMLHRKNYIVASYSFLHNVLYAYIYISLLNCRKLIKNIEIKIPQYVRSIKFSLKIKTNIKRGILILPLLFLLIDIIK